VAQRVASPRRRLLGRLGALAGAIARPVLTARSRAAIPPDRGRLPLPGLTAPAEVRFDRHGVPHVAALTDADALRALGWCHARDRFFQMDMLRRVLGSRLAETVGDRPLGDMALPPFGKDATTSGADHLMHLLDVEGAAQRTWAHTRGEGRALLAAYVQGVNGAVAMLRRRRPLEHRLLRLPLEAWRPVDSLLIAKGMALGLSFKWRAAPVFTAIAERLSEKPAHLASLLPQVPGREALTVLGAVAEGVSGLLRHLPLEAPMQGSNAWMVGGARSASGKPLLASDPHLELGLPSVWYLAGVRGARYAAVGATLPGLPGVVVGRTPTVAWGLTNAMLDDADLWLEELDEHGTHYRIDGAWRPLGIETRRIERRGRAPRLIRVRSTHRGPLLSDAFPAYEGPALSLRMTLHEPDRGVEALLALGRARDVADAQAAVRCFGAPAQSLLVADSAGGSAYRLMGRVPTRVRDDRHPALPRDGTRSATDWHGTVHDEELPAVDLGPEDQLVSANHPPVGPDYPHYLSHLYEPPYRALRIAVSLAGRDGLTAEDMRRLQHDAVDLAAPRLRRAVLEPHAEAVRQVRPALGPILDRVLAWSGDESAGARGAVAWHLVYHHLIRRTFEPLLGADLVRYWAGLINLVDGPLFAAFEDDDSPWAPPRVRATLLGEALEDARRDIAARGLDLDAPWGAMHELLLRHPAGAAGPLGTTFNRGPYPMAGGPYSVCSGQYLHARPGPMLVGASYRQVVDLGAPSRGRMSMVGGQSGHVGSPHYDDLTAHWLAGRTLPMHLEQPPPSAPVLHLLPIGV
jgi:penicillin amidase